MKLNKIFQTSFLSLALFGSTFCVRANSVVEMFEGILFSVQQTCEEKSKERVDQDFQNLIQNASTQFQELYKKLREGYSFIEYAYVQQSFSELCKNIKKIDKKILKSEKLCASDLNRLMKLVKKFKDETYSELSDSDESEEKQLEVLYKEVKIFFKTTNKIYKKSYCIIGSLSARTWEFIKDYWQIGAGIAGTAAAIKVAYDMRHYREHYKDSTDSSLYRNILKALFVIGIGSLYGAGDYFDGCVGSHEGPVGRNEDTEGRFQRRSGHGEIRFFEQQDGGDRTWRDDKNITLIGELIDENFNFKCHVATVPCVRQSGGTCGYHALFNASNMYVEHYDELMNRDLCIGKIDEWKKVIGHNEWLHKEDMEKIFASNDSGLRQTILDESNKLKENVSIIELPEIMRKLSDLERNIYEVEYSEQQHGRLHLRGDVKCRAKSYRDSSKEKRQRVEHLFHGNPDDLIPGMRVMPIERQGIDENVIRNINNFQDDNTPQIIILNTGGHWIAIRLEVKDGVDHITVADSYGSGYEGSYKNSIQQLYYIFRRWKIPDEMIPRSTFDSEMPGDGIFD